MTDAIGLYIHIPFCATKCNYCNFNTYTRLEKLIPSYIDALSRELHLWGDSLGHPGVKTVYFGGGTPSLLEPSDLSRVLDACRSAFSLQPNAEISAEANPGDVTAGKMRQWRSFGINRLSMGFQSVDDRLLRLLTRRHSSQEALAAYSNAREAGLDNVSLDFIYGLPHQTIETWRATLDQAISLAPEHLSLYSLTVEEGTPLHADVRSGLVPQPDPDLAADMYILADGLLNAAGYVNYEISNWAKPGKACRHNLIYWQFEPFLGVGPGAHSHLETHRFWDIRSPAEYIKRVQEKTGGLPVVAQAPFSDVLQGAAWVEGSRPIGDQDRFAETVILALRLRDGVSLDHITATFGPDAATAFLHRLEGLSGLGLLERNGDTVRLTQRGRLLSNEVFIRFLPEWAESVA